MRGINLTASEQLDAIFEEVEKLLKDEACTDSDTERKVLVEKGLKRAAGLLELAPDYHNTYHLHGLLWYRHPDKGENRSRKIKEYLNRAVSMNLQESQFSIQYLGYIHFDEKNYSEALKWFERTDEAYFEEDDKRWRWLKARELALVCRGRIDRRVDLEEARSLAAEYICAEEEDHCPANPSEVSEFARDAIDDQLEDCEAFAAVVVFMLKESNMEFLIDRYDLAGMSNG